MKNLFFNIPARRKFLKANSTELSNILAEFERIALVHPDVAFYLYSNDAELFNLPVMPLRQRILAIFGKKLNQQLLSVDVDTTMIKFPVLWQSRRHPARKVRTSIFCERPLYAPSIFS